MVVVEEIDDIEVEDEEEDTAKSRPWEDVGREGEPLPAKKEPFACEEEDEYTKSENRRAALQFAKADVHRKKGNALLAEGEYEKALRQYEYAHDELHRVGNTEAARKRHPKESLVLYLNQALAHLKQGTLTEAKAKTDLALMTDPQCVKALYRRGLAQARLAREANSYQDYEARGAISDFEALLKIEPDNVNARRELQQVRQELRASKLDTAKTQKEVWGGLLGGRTESAEPDLPDVPLPAVRACADADRHLVVSLEEVTVSQKGCEVLKGLSLEVKNKWCMGLLADAASSRDALVQVLTQRLSPGAGKITIHDNEKVHKAKGKPKFTIDVWTWIQVSIGCVAVLIGLALVDVHWQVLLASASVAITTIAIVGVLVEPEKTNLATVQFFNYDASARASLPARSTVEELIGKHLAKSLKKDARRERVVAMLRAIGFHLHPDSTSSDTLEKQLEDGLRVSQLSEGQKQLIHFLICFAKKTTVLVCNEPLVGVEKSLQPRVLRMLTRMKQEIKTSVVYLSADLAQLRCVSDSLGLLAEGELREMGPAEEVLTCPRTDDVKELLAPVSKAHNGLGVNGDPLYLQYVTTAREKALTDHWLPNYTGFVYNDQGAF
mmetsp:Transcript_119780/g.267400  ORF Transcript_119780/g.267400 Transcript_119780/m.267400 type:complete len:609 (-) Transcript_119780:52-1878(-)